MKSEVYDVDWANAPKVVDPNFPGSIFEALGFDDVLCPNCGAHLRNGICLNACHLTEEAQNRFKRALCVAKIMMESNILAWEKWNEAQQTQIIVSLKEQDVHQDQP